MIERADMSIVWDFTRCVSRSGIKHQFGAPAELQFYLETPLGYDNLDYCTHKIPWQLEHPDRSSCFAFSLLFRGFLFDCPDLPEFRARLLVVTSGPVAFSTLGGWPRTIFTKMAFCTTVETSGEVFRWFSFRESINMFLIVTVAPGLI
jgi:hypothetical protein